MPLHIVRNDITHMSCDAIVNAANPQLRPGGGVCGAIFAASDAPALGKACKALGGCPTGSAVLTDSFGMNWCGPKGHWGRIRNQYPGILHS